YNKIAVQQLDYLMKNKANFAKDLKNIKWDKLYDCTNVNSAYGFFIKRILNSFDKNFQPIKLSRKRAADKNMDNSCVNKIGLVPKNISFTKFGFKHAALRLN